MSKQKTIKKTVTVEGPGLFNGQNCSMRFVPAPPDSGVAFLRTDVDPPVRIPADIAKTARRDRRTSLSEGEVAVETVEHVLSAVWGMGIDNLTIEADTPEAPNTDGSAKIFADAIAHTGLQEQDVEVPVYAIAEPIVVTNGQSMLSALPGACDRLEILYDLDYAQNPGIGRQTLRFDLGVDDYATEIAPARTFLLQAEAEKMRSMGIGNHLTENEILVFTPSGELMGGELISPDEPVRHKVCDLIGDLSLLGRRVTGRIVASRSGHVLNRRLVSVLADRLAGTLPPAHPPCESMDINDIIGVLPHRYPFLMLDRVLEIQGNQRAVAVKNVTINEPFFQGHYPGQPIMPGVLIVEAMAQLSGILLGRHLAESGKVAMLLAIDNVRMRKPVRPGDRLIIKAEALRVRPRMGHCKCEARVDGQLTTEAEIKFMLVDADKVRQTNDR
ncbi:MAG: UDP-3-O-acyl-N-acetylglucosamine deacetylase [Phycisphaerae bacterium]|nr:UDP-3-O-acyl-N-acetylglucosamine deacetylase [Phycisphaerae bacterium]